MSSVNADITEILDTWKSIKTAITSVQTTKAIMTKKYHQLNGVWKDKKYNELGDVVQECNKALNDILKLLLKGEKFIGSLAKSLQEYENVNLAGEMSADNSFVQGLRAITPSSSTAATYQYCLGVLTKGTIPDGYMNIISERYQNSDEGVRRLFDNYADQIMIQDANYPPNETAHYSPMNYEGHRRGVYYNATSDMTNPRGNGTTYYHELAHMIDHASMGYEGYLSNSTEFRQALLSDGQRILNAYNGASTENQERFINGLRSNNRTHSFQDLLDAVTNGQINAGWSHSRDYWQTPGNLEAEAFAHFFEASMGARDKLERFAHYFPTAYNIFSTMINNILPAQRERVLGRSR